MSWQKTAQQEWTRAASGTEQFMLAASEGGLQRYNIKATVLTSLRSPLPKDEVSSLMRQAWHSILIQVPNVSMKPSIIKRNFYELKYCSALPSESEAQDWLSMTFHEQSFSGVSDHETFMVEREVELGQYKFPSKKISNASILLYYFLDEQNNVKHIAVNCFTNHVVFDGSGIYLCIDRFLKNAAHGVTPTALLSMGVDSKASPELPVLAYVNSEILEADHSLLIKQTLDAFVLPSTCHNVARDHPPQDEPIKFNEARHVFTKHETAQLLLGAKKLGLTISQFARAAFYVPILQKFPTESHNSILAYLTPINLREKLHLPSPYFGNAVSGVFGHFTCQGLTKAVMKGETPLKDSKDAQALYDLAEQFTITLQQHKQISVEKFVASDKVIEKILERYDPHAPPMAVPQGQVSDGLLERYIQRTYLGENLQLDVEDVHLTLQEPSPIVRSRTSTFKDRLSLTMTFDLRSWKLVEVQEMVQQWASILQFTMEHAVPNLKG